MTGTDKLARLQRALDFNGPTHRISDVVDMIRDGKAQLWENEGAVTITEIVEYPLFKTVNFWLSAGELKHCLALEHDVLPWAVEQGCTVATVTGRPGWGRLGARTGWQPWWPSWRKILVRMN
ncbi:MAG TPA: hypothetical protein VGH84_06405 [Steroidobacteraceae bacterium]|jgi:hypothetical protein